MPEFFWCVSGSDANPTTVMPYYFNEMQYEGKEWDNDDTSKVKYAKGCEQEFMSGVMSFPIIRNGVRLSLLDEFYSMDERDVRLCLDRMVRMPSMMSSTTDSNYLIYKYGQSNEGIPVLNGLIQIINYLSTPRELGWFMTAPAGVLRSADNLKANTTKYGVEAHANLSDPMYGDTSYRMRCYKGTTSVNPAILSVEDVNIGRSQAFRQYWDETPAVRMANIGDETDKTYRARPETGFLVSLRQVFGNGGTAAIGLKTNQGYFRPFTCGFGGGSHNNAQPQTNDTGMSVIALHKGLWGRLQRLPMVISPWDTCDFDNGNGANYDPYDFAYMFGFAGMMASDYNQDLYNRTNLVQSQGWLYAHDPFVKDSPVFRDSVKYTL